MANDAPSSTGRLAPSPTGGLHLGHARTFLIAWLSIRSQGGRVILRIEDLDATRARSDAVQGAIDDLQWLGLSWDAGPDAQSRRMSAYEASLERLKRKELVYPCTCTRADIERAASAPHPEDEGPTYPGTCATRSSRDAGSLDGRPYAWRFRVSDRFVSWTDRVQGEMSLNPCRLGGDFVVARSGIGASYQLAVVHDDATMGVTEVIRGDDLVPSTPRQILLYRALGWEPPSFGHVPLAVGPDGRRLAKRDGSLKLASVRQAGLDSRRLVGWLARSCGWSSSMQNLAPIELVERFDLSTIPSEPWVITPESIDELFRP